jgi:hypothetical protein
MISNKKDKFMTPFGNEWSLSRKPRVSAQELLSMFKLKLINFIMQS